MIVYIGKRKLGTCTYLHQYEVSMSNHVAKRTVHRRKRQQQTKHDCTGTLVDKPNEN